MAPAISDNPTMNQFLRERDKPVTQTNLDMIGELIGKKGSKTTRIPADKVEMAGKLPFVTTNGNGPSGDKPEESKPKAEESAFDYSAFAEWTQSISWISDDETQTPHAGQVIAQFKSKVEGEAAKPVDLQRYYTADGGIRVMKTRERLRRAGHAAENRYGTSYYLLSTEKEREGIELLRNFPGCPTLETPCPQCGTQLFNSGGPLTDHLRSVLERILVGAIKLTPGVMVAFRRAHADCWRFSNKVEELKLQRVPAIDKYGRKGDSKAMTKELSRLDAAAAEELYQLISGFKHVRQDRMSYYRGVIAATFTYANNALEG